MIPTVRAGGAPAVLALSEPGARAQPSAGSKLIVRLALQAHYERPLISISITASRVFIGCIIDIGHASVVIVRRWPAIGPGVGPPTGWAVSPCPGKLTFIMGKPRGRVLEY